MNYSKWFWLIIGIGSLAVSVWRLAMPYEIKASDPMSKVAIDTALSLAFGVLGIVCLFRFIKLFKKDRRQQKIVDNFGEH